MKFETIPFKHLLSEIIDNRGKTCPTVDDGIPLIATNCVNNSTLYPTYDKIRYVSEETYENWFRGHPEPGDILFVTKGSPGRCNFVPDPVKFCIAQDMVSIRADEDKIDSKFLFALLRSPQVQHQIGNMHVGSLIPHFKKGDFDKLFLEIPVDREYQGKVGEQYFTFSQKIHLNQQNNETLEAMAQAIFKSWFVDFEPVHAKINAATAGHDPSRAAMAAIAGVASFAEATEVGQDWDEVETALDQKLRRMTGEQQVQLSRIAELFPDELVESEIGQVPKGWGISKLEDYMTLSYGKGLRKKDRKEGIVPVYGSGGLTGTHDESLIEGPGIIVGRKGTVGSIYWEDKGFWPIDTVFYVEPKNEIDLSFYYYLLNTLGLDDMNTDAAVPGLNRNNAYRLKIPAFPDELMNLFSDFTFDIHKTIDAKKEETKTLENLRDTLLPKLISGEVEL